MPYSFWLHWRLSPAKPVGHDSHTEGSHHAADAEDGHGDTPDDSADSLADWLSVALHPSVVEERSQFLDGDTTQIFIEAYTSRFY